MLKGFNTGGSVDVGRAANETGCVHGQIVSLKR